MTTDKMTDKSNSTLLQFIRFGIVGISNTVIGYLLNIGTLFLLKPLNISWDYYIGNVVSFVLGVLWVFFWNYKYVFKMNEKTSIWWKVLLKTYVTYGISGLILTNVLSWIWVEHCSISKYIAPIINLFITVPVNFLLNKFWAFKSNTQ